MPSIPTAPHDFKNFRVMDNIGEHLPVPACKLNAQIQPDDSVLLIRLSALGDAIRLLPAVEYLRNNEHRGEIAVAAQPPLEQLFDNYPGITRTHCLPLKSALRAPGKLAEPLKKLRNQNYDWVFDCHGLLKSGLVSLLSGGNQRVGPARPNSKELNFLFHQYRITAQPNALARILFYIQLMRPFSPDYKLTLDNITPGPFKFTSVNKNIKKVAEDNPIVIHPRSSHGRYGRAKEWGIGNFSSLVERILPQTDKDILITWGPGELNSAERLAGSFNARVLPAPETTTLIDLAYLIDRAELVISVDTLVSHLADLQQTPLIVFYTASSFHINAPLFAPARTFTSVSDNEIITPAVSRASGELLTANMSG